MVAPDQAAAERRQTWARGMIARATGPVPVYGTPEWVDLPDGPEKTAAVIIAAEGRIRDAEAELWLAEYEALVSNWAPKHAEDDAYVSDAETHAAYWKGAAEAITRRAS